jgi:hypothetical protein
LTSPSKWTYRLVSSTRISIIDILSSEDNHWKYSSGSEVLTGGLTGSLDSSKGSISCGTSNLSEFCTVHRYVGFKS